MTFDIFGGDPPAPGLFLVSDRRRYVVLSVRPIDSKLWHDRWALDVRRLAKEEAVPEGARVWDFTTDNRATCRKCQAATYGVPVPDYVVHGAACGLANG